MTADMPTSGIGERSLRMIRTKSGIANWAALCGAILLSACATRLGPRTIPAPRFDYNERIARSQNDQLLLNLVRLRYRDTPVFLDVGTAIAQYTLDARVGVFPRNHVDGTDGTELGVDLGGRYSEQPTITYEPISGAEFTQRLLTPISPSTIILLSQSGWSVERLLMCCVDRMNDVTNAPVASERRPGFPTTAGSEKWRACSENCRFWDRSISCSHKTGRREPLLSESKSQDPTAHDPTYCAAYARSWISTPLRPRFD